MIQVRGPALASPPPAGAPESSALADALAREDFVITVEVEPPKSADTTAVEDAARMLRDAGATVLDISDIPMARMRMTGLAAAHRVQRRPRLETVLHFPVRGRNLLRVQGDLLAAHALDVRNLFVTMGDPTRIGDFPQANDHHDIVPTGLVQLVKQQLNAGVDGAGASIGQPCRFIVGVAANLTPDDFDKEAKLLRKKIDSGADFALDAAGVRPADVARSFLAHYERLFGHLRSAGAGRRAAAGQRAARAVSAQRGAGHGDARARSSKRLASAGTKTRTGGDR